MFLLGGIIINVSAYTVPEIYPEDYSFRSGLTYKVRSYDSTGALLSEENTIWNSRYPFRNPVTDPLIRKDYTLSDNYVQENIGFKIRMVRVPGSAICDSISGICSPQGHLQHSIALIPVAEAKDNVVYDSGFGTGNRVFGSITETYDVFGNPKRINNLGYTGRDPPRLDNSEERSDAFTDEAFKMYKITNPNHLSPGTAMLVSSEFTNLQTDTKTQPNLESNLNKRDNIITETTFLHEDFPYNSAAYTPAGGKAMGLYSFKGWTHLPHVVVTRDGFGRVLNTLTTFYDTYGSSTASVGACNQPDNIDGMDCIGSPASCDLHPYGSLTPETCSDFICIRQNPSSIKTTSGLADGYYARAALQQDLDGAFRRPKASTNLDFRYDNCGNVIQTRVEGTYVPSHFSVTKDGEGYEELSIYSKSVFSEFPGKKIVPTRVATWNERFINNPPSSPQLAIEKTATYLNDQLIQTSTNERGFTTTYEYDILGRITKIIVPPDTLENPTIKYFYEADPDIIFPSFDRIKVKSRTKIDVSSNVYGENYFFYDGMGRLVETQAEDQGNNGFILSQIEYDGIGRKVKESKPIFVRSGEGTFGTRVGDSGPAARWRSFEYDGRDRLIETTDFDGSTTETAYSINFVDSQDQIKSTDQLGNEFFSFSNERGNLIGVDLPTP